MSQHNTQPQRERSARVARYSGTEDASMTRHLSVRNVLVGAVLTLTLLMSACAPDTEVPSPESQVLSGSEQDALVTRQVRVTKPAVDTLQSERSAAVNIEPSAQSTIASQATGQVATIFAREGTSVAEGDVVIQLQTTNLALQVETAQLALQSAEVNLATAQRAGGDSQQETQVGLLAARSSFELAEKQLNESRQLLAAGGISPNELLSIEAQYNQAKLSLEQAQSATSKAGRIDSEDLALLRLQVRQARAQLNQAREALANASIRAPFSGEIAAIFVNRGELLGEGGQAFTIVSNEGQYAKFSVPVAEARLLEQQGLIHIPYAGLNYAAQIIRVAPVPAQDRLVALTARVYPSETRIPNGTTTTLKYRVNLAEGLTLPADAVQVGGAQRFVYLADQGRAVRQRVQVVAEDSGTAVVSGIGPDASVIYPVPDDLVSGTPVDIVGGVSGESAQLGEAN